MATAMGGGGVSKGETQPTGNSSGQPFLHHPSDCTGRQPPTGTEHQRSTGLPTRTYIKRTDSPEHSKHAQYRQGKALSAAASSPMPP